jgi:hypothetical protein
VRLLTICLAALLASLDAAAPPAPAFPPRLEAYLRETVRLTDDERAVLSGGRPVTRELPGNAATEIALFGAVWIDALPAAYVQALQDIASFEHGGGIRLSRKVGTPARLADFAELRLPEDDVADLRACRVGDCALKLSAEALDLVRTRVDWSAPDARSQVEALVRQVAVDYVTAYREGGNDRLAVYRDHARPTFVASEFEALVAGMPGLTAQLPDLQAYLLHYPRASAPVHDSFIYWQEASFGLKPVVRINHVVVQQAADATIVASKLLYASHYFWTALELRVLVPDPARGPGFWFVTMARSRSDGLTGVRGRLIGGRVRRAARQGIEAALAATKARLEH